MSPPVGKTAPDGDDLSIRLLFDSTTWVDLTILDGDTEVTLSTAAVEALATIPAATNLRLDLLGVGTTFPAADLAVFIYL